jgi:pantoate--beta-alanine ligase
VVAKLLNAVEPDMAYFGQKDAQQAIIIKKMVADLNMNVRIAVCPTVRETDGLAISSRNKYLNAEERREATVLYAALQLAKTEIKGGQAETASVIKKMKGLILSRSSGRIDYVAIVDPETLADVKRIRKKVLVALAVKIGGARLIDNVLITP